LAQIFPAHFCLNFSFETLDKMRGKMTAKKSYDRREERASVIPQETSLRIAVIGAGFSGLSVAWHLLERSRDIRVVLFDSKGIGGGASGIAAGLLHPYVGEEGRRSLLATQGIEATEELLAVAEKHLGRAVADRRGIHRQAMSGAHERLFHSHAGQYGDIVSLANGRFLIKSGLTIDCPGYLEGLWRGVAAKGGVLIEERVDDLSSMAGFDQIIVAAGSGALKFAELASLSCKVSKGQVLVCRASSGLPERSLIGRGYIALAGTKDSCYVGSTYERGEVDEIPNPTLAEGILFPKIEQFFPAIRSFETVGCRAAMRLTRSGHYFPVAAKIREGIYVLTAMGSRGLLYHALLGQKVAEAVLKKDLILPEDAVVSSDFSGRR
jgi:glycine/D-amino acid oxidase-like deaminating enzyme